MKDVKEESKLLASLALFRELYNEQKEIYGIISLFLDEVITSNRRYQFNLTEISSLLNDTFDFSIPEAVVATALRRLGLKKEKGIYVYNKKNRTDKISLQDLQDKKLLNNNSLIEGLFSFIQTEKQSILSNADKFEILDSLHAFLLDDSNGTDYSEYVSGFIIKNKNEENFMETLKQIREGVILYSGIKFSNLGEIGSWRTSLTIYLDTEILFHFAGYNGSLFRSLFTDFFEYVKEINAKARRQLIRLEYFKEVKNEIIGFFSTAERIIEGKESLYCKNTAMTSILEGCKTPGEVLEKKSDFFVMLAGNGINESEPIDCTTDLHHKYNIYDEKTICDISQELKTDITDNLKFLNFVSLKRADESSAIFENIGFILLTGNLKTIRVALHEKIKPGGTVPLATTLDWITNRFWFKLNKGFGNENSPISFNVVTKAQIILSKNLNNSIQDYYDELICQFRGGEITEEQAKARLVALREKVRKPEEIDDDDISGILDVLSEDSIEKYIQEQEISKNETRKQQEENIKLKNQLITKENALAKEEGERKAIQLALIKTLDENLKTKKAMISTLESQQKPIDIIANRKYQNFKYSIGFAISVAYLFIVWVMSKIGWDFFEPLYLIIIVLLPQVLLLLYLLKYEKEWEWKPKQFLQRKKEQYMRQNYQKFCFDINQLDVLNEEVLKIEAQIQELTEDNVSKTQNSI